MKSPALLAALCMALLALMPGCDGGDSAMYSAESSEPNFERGAQLMRQGRNQEALAAYLKVIAKRGDDAPESHLEAAAIYKQHIKDYLAAIYHFRKYLELQPNSRQAELVKQQIQACTREFARSLPAHPLNDASVRLGYMDQIDRLQRENDQLKSEIAALRAGLPAAAGASNYRPGGFEIPSGAPVTAPSPRAVAVENPGEEAADAPFTRAPESAQQAVRPAQPSAPATPKPAQPAAARRHVVAKGDTLSSLSLKYYGTRSKVAEIRQANKELLAGGDRLSIGMELVLP